MYIKHPHCLHVDVISIISGHSLQIAKRLSASSEVARGVPFIMSQNFTSSLIILLYGHSAGYPGYPEVLQEIENVTLQMVWSELVVYRE